MPTKTHISAFLQLGRLPKAEPEKTDAELMNDLIQRRCDQAFDALLRRHGPMVWSVCKGIAHHTQDAEDAFQATFLVLIQKGNTVQPRRMVGNWLHGVAVRAAQKVRSDRFRRQAKEMQAAGLARARREEVTVTQETVLALNQAIQSLPEKYRTPLILCDIEGKTRNQAAYELGWAAGSVGSRLFRARQLLAKRLKRLGYCSASSLLGVARTNGGALSPSLMVTTRRMAFDILSGGYDIMRVVHLMNKVNNSIMTGKLKAVFFSLSLITCLAMGTYGLVWKQTVQTQSQEVNPPTSHNTPSHLAGVPTVSAERKYPQGTHHFCQWFANIYAFMAEVNMTKEGKLDQAVKQWEIAHQLYPECKVFSNNIAYVLTCQKSDPDNSATNLQKAEQIINSVIARSSEKDIHLPHYYGTRGSIYLKMKRFEDARRDLEAACKRASAKYDFVLHGQLVEVYNQLKMPGLAEHHQQIIDEIKKGYYRREPMDR